MDIKALIFIALMILGIKNEIIAQSDCLDPIEEKDFRSSFYKLEYYYSIRNILFEGLTYKPEIRYIHSFGLGSPLVLDIEYNDSETKYFLILHTFSKRILFQKNIEEIQMHIYKKEISKESVDLIKELFETAIKNAKSGSNKMGLDGTSYYFFVNNNQILNGGTVWSPNKKSKMERLAKIGVELIKLTSSKTEIVEFDVKLTKEIINLNNELK